MTPRGAGRAAAFPGSPISTNFGLKLRTGEDRVALTVTSSVVRLVPDFSSVRGMLVDETTSARLLHLLKAPGAPWPWSDGGAQGLWTAGDDLALGDYPCGLGYAPVFSKQLWSAFEGALTAVGRGVPIAAPGLAEDDYRLFVVDRVVDCLDVKRSAKPRRYTGEMDRVVFDPARLPVDAPAFRVPQSPLFVFWNGAFAERLREQRPSGVKSLLVWSEDPSAKPFPSPMR